MGLVNNAKLSLRDKGLLYVLKNSNLDKVTQRGLTKTNADGLCSVESGIRHLKEQGYLTVHRLKNGQVKYHLKSSSNSKNRTVASKIIALLKNNRILYDSRHNREILEMVDNGYTFGDFWRAVSVVISIDNLGLSNKYQLAYKHGVEHFRPSINRPYSYIIKIIKDKQTYADVHHANMLMSCYIHLVSKDKIHEYYVNTDSAPLPADWVSSSDIILMKDELNHDVPFISI